MVGVSVGRIVVKILSFITESTRITRGIIRGEGELACRYVQGLRSRLVIHRVGDRDFSIPVLVLWVVVLTTHVPLPSDVKVSLALEDVSLYVPPDGDTVAKIVFADERPGSVPTKMELYWFPSVS